MAQDPVLLQPISNGHAARMRYARFKSSVVGTDSEKKGRITDKGRITKPRKHLGERKEGIIKPEPGVNMMSLAQVGNDTR